MFDIGGGGAELFSMTYTYVCICLFLKCVKHNRNF